MPENSAGEKTLPASPRKLERQREQGNVPKSQDLNAAVTLFVALIAMYIFGRQMLETMLEATRYYMGSAGTLILDTGTAQGIGFESILLIARVTVPFMIVMLVFGILVNVVQFGPLFAPMALIPKFERLNPINGLKRFFSLRSLVELCKSLFKLLFIGTIVYFTLRGQWGELKYLLFLTPQGITHEITGLVLTVWLRIVLAMLLIGVVDFAFQKWQFLEDQRMTHHESREELKELEGHPQIRQRVRQLQRQMATQRMMAEVPTAEVVITNPVHYAVALRYNMEEMDAPVVVAKGERLVAKRIRESAVEHDVPIVEQPELARTLYRNVDLRHPIPEDLFRAVAEVLAFVYRVDRRTAKQTEREQAAATAM